MDRYIEGKLERWVKDRLIDIIKYKNKNKTVSLPRYTIYSICI